jgi:hypothetical protein
MPLKHILKNKLLLQKHFHTQEEAMDKWPFWMFEENIKLVNEISEEEEKNRKNQEEGQNNSMGNFDTNSVMKSASNMTNNISIPKF